MTAKCNICGNEGKFLLKEGGREGNLCANCSASSRHRAVIYAFGLWRGTAGVPLAAWQPEKHLRILESSGRSSYPMMLKEKFEYYNTEYNPESDLINKPFTRYADFQNMAYPDNQFDVIIATDVFEHVREDDKAFAEVFRVLKKEGVFILTVPYDHNLEQTLVRVKVAGDKDIHLLPPEYHGGGGQTLAYRSYGRDLLDRLRRHGFSVGYLDLEVPRNCIDKQSVILGIKDSFFDLTLLQRSAGNGTESNVKASPLLPFRIFLIIKYNLFSVKHFIHEIGRRFTDTFRMKPRH